MGDLLPRLKIEHLEQSTPAPSPAHIGVSENTETICFCCIDCLLFMSMGNICLRALSVLVFQFISSCTSWQNFSYIPLKLPELGPHSTCISLLPCFAFSAECMTMQGLGSRHGSDSTINDFELHRSSTPQNPPASSSSTLVNGTTFASNAASFSDISSASSASSVVDSTPPWWEAQAEHILRGSDLQAIRLLCRYHVYGENSIPESILRKRWGPRLNSFLLVLNPYNRHEINEFSLDQKVSEILTHLVPSVPSTSNSRDLASPSLLLESYSSCLASKLDEESLLRRRKVTFADCVSEALYPGKTVESIENFIDWHDTLYNIVSDRLEEYPDEVVKYAQIEQVSVAVSTPFPLLTGPATTRREPCALGGLAKPTASTVLSPKRACTSAQSRLYYRTPP